MEIRGRKAVAALIAAGVLALAGCSAPSATSASAQNKQQEQANGSHVNRGTDGRDAQRTAVPKPKSAAEIKSERLGKEVNRLWMNRSTGTKPLDYDGQFWWTCFPQSTTGTDADNYITFSTAQDASWWRMSWQQPSQETAEAVFSVCASSLEMPEDVRKSVRNASTGWHEAEWTGHHPVWQEKPDAHYVASKETDRYRMIYGHNPDDWNNVIIQKL